MSVFRCGFGRAAFSPLSVVLALISAACESSAEPVSRVPMHDRTAIYKSTACYPTNATFTVSAAPWTADSCNYATHGDFRVVMFHAPQGRLALVVALDENGSHADTLTVAPWSVPAPFQRTGCSDSGCGVSSDAALGALDSLTAVPNTAMLYAVDNGGTPNIRDEYASTASGTIVIQNPDGSQTITTNLWPSGDDDGIANVQVEFVDVKMTKVVEDSGTMQGAGPASVNASGSGSATVSRYAKCTEPDVPEAGGAVCVQFSDCRGTDGKQAPGMCACDDEVCRASDMQCCKPNGNACAGSGCCSGVCSKKGKCVDEDEAAAPECEEKKPDDMQEPTEGCTSDDQCPDIEYSTEGLSMMCFKDSWLMGNDEGPGRCCHNSTYICKTNAECCSNLCWKGFCEWCSDPGGGSAPCSHYKP